MSSLYSRVRFAILIKYLGQETDTGTYFTTYLAYII